MLGHSGADGTPFRIPEQQNRACYLWRMQAKQSTAHRSLPNSTAESTLAQLGKPFTKRELSRFLGISERFIELEVNRGRLRAVKLSNRLLRFRPSDVDRWMESSLTAAADSIRDEY